MNSILALCSDLGFSARMVSTVKNAAIGASNSRALRSAASRVFLEDFYLHVRDLARRGELSNTNVGLAAQLRAAGMEAPNPEIKKNGKKRRLDDKVVQSALSKMGIERTSIRRWRGAAHTASENFGVPLNLMLDQLWHEWLWHEKESYLVHGLSIKERDQRQFIPVFVHPNHWVPPSERNPDSILHKVPAEPPSARIVQALIGLLDPDDSGNYEV